MIDKVKLILREVCLRGGLLFLFKLLTLSLARSSLVEAKKMLAQISSYFVASVMNRSMSLEIARDRLAAVRQKSNQKETPRPFYF